MVITEHLTQYRGIDMKIQEMFRDDIDRKINGVVKVEVINQSNQEVQVTNTKTRNDLEGTVLSIVINGINNNKMGLRTMIGGR